MFFVCMWYVHSIHIICQNIVTIHSHSLEYELEYTTSPPTNLEMWEPTPRLSVHWSPGTAAGRFPWTNELTGENWKKQEKQKLSHWTDLFGRSLKLISHHFLTLTLASKTQSQAARQTSAKVLAKCLRETNKKDAFNIPWNVPMRCLKFDSLKSSLKKMDQRSMKIELKIKPQGFSGLAPVMKKTVWCSVIVACRNLITDTCNDRKARNHWRHVFQKSWPCDFLQAWKGNHFLNFPL